MKQAKKLKPVPTVHLYWGKPGTGKTRAVWDNHEHSDIWSWPGQCWFDGYTDQRIALFDDFDEGPIPYRLLLKVIDRYTIQLPVKGGHVYFRPEHIYITSNVHPKYWYPKEPNVDALLRRFHEIKEFN